jgi:fluoroacetyl-CoA thioesterase
MPLEPGLVGTATLTVAEEHTAARIGSGRAPVFASPMMIALMEAAAVDCIERVLPDGQESLGISLAVEHIAATPVGVTVQARATLRHVDGRKLTFDVEAHDERELIGRGRHTRVLVDSARFRAKAMAKAPIA